MSTTGKFLLYLTSWGQKCYPGLRAFHPSSNVCFNARVLVCAFQRCFYSIYEPLTYFWLISSGYTIHFGADLQEKQPFERLLFGCYVWVEEADGVENSWTNSPGGAVLGVCFYVGGEGGSHVFMTAFLQLFLTTNLTWNTGKKPITVKTTLYL